MPIYDYFCEKCNTTIEITHSIKENPKFKCKTCKTKLHILVTGGHYTITSGIKGSIENHKESEHNKKVSDKERAIRKRKKLFGSEAVGNPVDKPDPRHVLKKGKTIAGESKEIDKQEFIKAAAKDPYMVQKAQNSLNKLGGN